MDGKASRFFFSLFMSCRFLCSFFFSLKIAPTLGFLSVSFLGGQACSWVWEGCRVTPIHLTIQSISQWPGINDRFLALGFFSPQFLSGFLRSFLFHPHLLWLISAESTSLCRQVGSEGAYTCRHMLLYNYSLPACSSRIWWMTNWKAELLCRRAVGTCEGFK